MSSSAKQMIASELRALRRLPGALDATKLIHARALVKGLGGDDPDVALRRLTGLARDHDGDREIEAAFASLGIGNTAVSVLDRLTEFGQLHYVDARTVRRWSDSGLRKLTMLIVGKEPWVQPRITKTVVVSDGWATVRIDVDIPATLWMNTPLLSVDGVEIELDTEGRLQDTAPIRRTVGSTRFKVESAQVTRIRLFWSGERFPRFVVSARGEPAHTFESQLQFSALSTLIRTIEHFDAPQPSDLALLPFKTVDPGGR
jgi:hypothetical protein